MKKKKESLIQQLGKKITNQDDALTLVRSGAVSGLIVVFMKVLSIVFLVSGISDITKLGYEEGDLVFPVVGEIFALCLYLFLMWRIYASKGWISSIILTAIFVCDYVIGKIVEGTFSFYVPMYMVIVLGMLVGCRGCWWFHKYPDYVSESTTDENTEGSLNGQDDEDEDDDNRGLPKDFWKL